MLHINALKTLTQGFRKKKLADWVPEMNPHEELVLLHILEHNLGNKHSNIHGHQFKIPMKKDKDIIAFKNHFKKHGKVKTAHEIHAGGFGSFIVKAGGKVLSKTGKFAKIAAKAIAKGAQKVGTFIAKYGKKAYDYAISHGVQFIQGVGSLAQVAAPILQMTGVIDEDDAMIMSTLGGLVSPESDDDSEEKKKKKKDKKGD